MTVSDDETARVACKDHDGCGSCMLLRDVASAGAPKNGAPQTPKVLRKSLAIIEL